MKIPVKLFNIILMCYMENIKVTPANTIHSTAPCIVLQHINLQKIILVSKCKKVSQRNVRVESESILVSHCEHTFSQLSNLNLTWPALLEPLL